MELEKTQSDVFSRINNVLNRINPRKLLFALNFLVAAFSLCLSGFSIFLCSLLYDPGFISGWVDWLGTHVLNPLILKILNLCIKNISGLSVVGLCLAIVCIVGMRGAHMVSLDHLLTYFWGIIVFIAPLLLGTVACFDFYQYMETWFMHQWEQPNFIHMRELFCPSNTAATKCISPIKDELTDSSWCIQLFNATDCVKIRQEAFTIAVAYGKMLTIAQASVCILDLVLIIFSVVICVGEFGYFPTCYLCTRTHKIINLWTLNITRYNLTSSDTAIYE